MRSRKLAGVLVTFLAGAVLLPGAARAQDDGPDGEVVALLQQLVQTNTSNPPGNEAQIAELLKARLEPLGFEVEIVPTPTAGKAHFIARLRAQSPTEKPLLLAGHEDVVGVERDLWTVDPFAGLIKGGLIYGRGAMDFKGGLAAFTVAASRIARAKVPLKRDIILLAEADEEGGDYGTGWLAKTNWPKIDAGVSLNEGGWVFEDGGGTPRLMSVTTIDKNSLSVTLKTRGNSTHSSRPLPDSALAHLTRALNRIERYEPATPRPGAVARRYLRTWAKRFGGRTARELRTFLAAKTAKARRRTARPLTRGSFGELFNGMLRTIYVPTIANGGFRSNVLPGSAEATVNIRLLPGARPRPAIRELERVIDDKRVKVAPISPKGETAAETLKRFDERAKQRPSGIDTELYRVLAREGKREWPTVGVTPALFEAGTDAVPWRERGIPVYGVYPYPITRAELADMHGNDERISVRRLEEGTDMLTRVLRGAAGR
jgi:acetylornithine deacetylase/succinyl-diaminopimelate desuccinylase-like protein